MDPSTWNQRGRPPVDPAVLARLRRDVGAEVVRMFVRTYVELLVSRLGRIERALARRDAAGAHHAVLDLRTSSAMLGAAPLAELAAEVERLLRADRIDAAAGRLPGLRCEAVAVVAALDGTNGRVQPPNL